MKQFFEANDEVKVEITVPQKEAKVQCFEIKFVQHDTEVMVDIYHKREVDALVNNLLELINMLNDHKGALK